MSEYYDAIKEGLLEAIKYASGEQEGAKSTQYSRNKSSEHPSKVIKSPNVNIKPQNVDS